ncbi:uncharacterized protein with FMN-binding domain [Leifsonia sp. AK011]|uniref:FMN-binding protein n=1 Tax=Leifsonia sp. AK011 TaxID=2723075 RepID=UPI001850D0E7|nr:FMN-binding protein [Leifsonia sp. AK011]NYF09079.1 uncharacterized protein with FMN-binding domain [Leifsonia sp. AK011]
MRTRALVGSIVASISLLVIGWQAGGSLITAPITQTTTSQPVDAGGTSAPTTTTPSPTATEAPTTEVPAATTPADGTYTGTSVSTRFGNVQVAVVISSGAITDVQALQLTDADGKSVQISNRAAPILREEVLASQSANVSNVGGATYTTRGYLTSLQSALDQAGF